MVQSMGCPVDPVISEKLTGSTSGIGRSKGTLGARNTLFLNRQWCYRTLPELLHEQEVEASLQPMCLLAP